jgi:hypothetical protein
MKKLWEAVLIMGGCLLIVILAVFGNAWNRESKKELEDTKWIHTNPGQ